MSEPTPLPLFHVVGFSGHRQIDRPVEAAAAIRRALEALKADGSGEWIALSSVALGGDTLFAEQALSMGITWHALLPLPAAEFRLDFSASDWGAAEALISKSEHVRVITENGSREDHRWGLISVPGEDDGGAEAVDGPIHFIALLRHQDLSGAPFRSLRRQSWLLRFHWKNGAANGTRTRDP